MQCTITLNCPGRLNLKPEQDDSIKFSWECDTCKEVKIEQRTKEELIDLYVHRVIRLKDGKTIQEIYGMEALELLQELRVKGVPDDDLKYLPIAEAITDRYIQKMGGKCI
jgi:hypothetical protein